MRPGPDNAVIRRVGLRIARLRHERGWSAAELARRAGVGKATLSEVESGRRNATLETLDALTSALEVPLSAPLLAPSGSLEIPRALVKGEPVIAELVIHDEAADTISELYRVSVRAHAPRHRATTGTGLQKTALVFQGAWRVEFADDAFTIKAGEDRTWTAEQPHAYLATDEQDVEAALLLRYPQA